MPCGRQSGRNAPLFSPYRRSIAEQADEPRGYPSGDQLSELGSLIESGAIRPVVDRVFPFQSTTEALAYVEKGRAKGKVVVKIR